MKMFTEMGMVLMEKAIEDLRFEHWYHDLSYDVVLFQYPTSMLKKSNSYGKKYRYEVQLRVYMEKSYLATFTYRVLPSDLEKHELGEKNIKNLHIAQDNLIEWIRESHQCELRNGVNRTIYSV